MSGLVRNPELQGPVVGGLQGHLCWVTFATDKGPVVQNFVSLMSSLRPKLVK